VTHYFLLNGYIELTQIFNVNTCKLYANFCRATHCVLSSGRNVSSRIWSRVTAVEIANSMSHWHGQPSSNYAKGLSYFTSVRITVGFCKISGTGSCNSNKET